MNAWIRRSPVLAFFVLAYLGTWIGLAPAVVAQNGLGLIPWTIPQSIFVPLFLLADYGGPFLAGLLVTRALGGGDAVRRWFRRFLQWRVGLRWWLLVLLGYPILYLAAASVSLGMAPWRAAAEHWSLFFTSYLPALVIFPALITWGEEPGWRGVALPLMQQRMSPLKASLLLGTLHGLWHLPVFLIPTFLGRPFTLGFFAFNTVVGALLTVSWGWLFNNTGGSILLAVMIHASSNATERLTGQLVPNWAGGAQFKSLALALVTLAIVVATRGRLGFDRKLNDSLVPNPAPADVSPAS
jgi:membrane protease YdiL (CAAX protease family)